MLKKKEDGRDAYREEYNRMIREQAIHEGYYCSGKDADYYGAEKEPRRGKTVFCQGRGQSYLSIFLDMGSRAWELDGVGKTSYFS